MLGIASILASCGGGGGGGGGTAPSSAPTLTLGTANVKTLSFSWSAVSGATHYQLYENPDGISGYTPIGGQLSGTSYGMTVAVHRHNWAQARYLVEACNSAGCGPDSNTVNTTGAVLAAIGYFKASNTDTYSPTGSADSFGYFVTLSGDGNTMAVGAYGEASSATGINGNQLDNSASRSGAVYVFTRSGGTWSQQAYVKASNASDQFGISVALSFDGNTLAVGANQEHSSATGINGNQLDNSKFWSGAVYVFTRSGGNWTQQAYMKASNTDANDYFGGYVALSSDGNTLAVGAYGEASSATGINGIQSDNSAANAGAVYVFTRSGNIWSQQAYVKASNTNAYDGFGVSVALSSNGDTLAVGAPNEASSATGINGNQSDNSSASSGAVYVFTRSGGTWSQQAYVKASNTDAGDNFGHSLALAADGSTLAIGAELEDSSATGINGDQTNLSPYLFSQGAVYVFARTGGTWSQQAYVKASNTDPGDNFGQSVSLAADGNTLAVGAVGEDSKATGINSDQLDNSGSSSGAVYLY